MALMKVTRADSEYRLGISRRGFLAAGGALGIGAFAAACGAETRSASPTAKTVTAPAGKPVSGGTLNYSDTQAVTTWQSQSLGTYSSGNLSFFTFTCLLYVDPVAKRLVPWVAKSWSANAANTEFTFTIRPGVTFSDGTPLTPDVVRQNLDRLGQGAPDLRIPANPYIAAGYDHAELVGEDQVKVVLTTPDEQFLLNTTRLQNALLAPSTLKLDVEEAGLPQNVIGAGPFVFKSQVPNESAVLVRRPDYQWAPASSANQGPAYLEEIHWQVLSEVGLRAGTLESGQVDLARGIQPSDEAGLAAAGYQVLLTRPTFGSSNYAAFRLDNPYVSDARVRQALLIGFDREQVTTTALTPNYPPARSILNEVNPAFADLSADLKYNPDKARSLLDEAGWTVGGSGIREKDGKQLQLTVPQDAQQVALTPAWTNIAQQWRQELGVVLDVRTDPAFAAEAGTEVSVPLLCSRTSIISLGQTFAGVGNTLTLASPPDLLALRKQELTATSTEAWYQVEQTEQHVIVGDPYAIPTFEEGQVSGASSKVKVGFTSTTYPDFYNAWKTA
jgi:peptide/nickel transport system substrate-binding protein